MPEGIIKNGELTRRLTIKLGIYKRCKKELACYQQEWEAQMRHIESMESKSNDTVCPHDVAKQRQVLQETAMMIPGCQERVTAAHQDLQSFLNRHKVDEFDSPVLYQEACTILIS